MGPRDRSELDAWRLQVFTARAHLVPFCEAQARALVKKYRAGQRPVAEEVALGLIPICIRHFSPSFLARFETVCTWRMKAAIGEALSGSRPELPSMQTTVDFSTAWARHRSSASAEDSDAVCFDTLLEEQRVPLQAVIANLLAAWQTQHDGANPADDRIDFTSYVRVSTTPPRGNETTWELSLESDEHDATLHVFMDGWQCTRIAVTS